HEDRRRRLGRQRRLGPVRAARRRGPFFQRLMTHIPERITRLPELATDLWGTWNQQGREVFRRLDYLLWRQTAHNPVLMLRLVSQEQLEQAAQDENFLAVYDAAPDALDRERTARHNSSH